MIKSKTDNREQIETLSKNNLPEHIVKFIEECRSQPRSESQLIAVLHKVQAHYGYLGQDQLYAVAQLLQAPTAKVAGVATFYHFFRLEPRGTFLINVCMGTACYVKGAEKVAQRLRDELGINFGESTKDGVFSLEGTRCLGTCGLAPVIMINDEVHGPIAPDEVPLLIQKYRKMAREMAKD